MSDPKPEAPDWAALAQQLSTEAADAAVPGAPNHAYIVPFLKSWAAFVNAQVDPVRFAHSFLNQNVQQIERESYNRGYDNAVEHEGEALITAQTRANQLGTDLDRSRHLLETVASLLPRIEELEVRDDFHYTMFETGLGITPEDPDPGRDWSRVRAHLFTSRGKWKYQVWLDYTGLRHRGVPGEGPAGWHFDGDDLAKLALSRATRNGTSGVSITQLGDRWHLFVPNPPQGYPLWVQPDSTVEEFLQNKKNDRIARLVAKIDDIRGVLRAVLERQRGGMDADVLAREIEEVLDR